MSGDANFAGAAISGPASAETQELLNSFWSRMLDDIQNLKATDFKVQDLPLARIKKIMKLDDDVKMISAEAPVLFAKAAEIFISELSLRAWIHTEESKRRTLQKNDVALAVTKYDQYDFLIDIVPRDDIKPIPKRPDDTSQRGMTLGTAHDQVQYYLQLAQQNQVALQHQAGQQAGQPAPTIQLQSGHLLQQPIQLQVGGNTILAIPASAQGDGSRVQQQPQIIQLQQPAAAQAQQQAQQIHLQQVQHHQPQTQQVQQTTQVFQQIIMPSGDVKNVPIQLNPSQLQQIQLQLQGSQPGQPIIIQTNTVSAQQGQGHGDSQLSNHGTSQFGSVQSIFLPDTEGEQADDQGD